LEEKRKALKSAFPVTIPVMMGYLFIGVAFGMLMASKGYSFGWSILMSVCIYAGSMQFVATNFFAGSINWISIIFITFMVNIRHIFYGLSMLTKFKNTGRKKPYLIFSLTDETFSLLCSADAPEGVNQGWFLFFIALLDQIYWVVGSALGGMIGSLVPFSTKGIDFAMTALFVVIFVEQWQSSEHHLPAVAGVLASVLCLLVFGVSNFILPAMILMVSILTATYQKPKEERDGDGNA
jgi:4-azaleucine resistance transporter AzlC